MLFSIELNSIWYAGRLNDNSGNPAKLIRNNLKALINVSGLKISRGHLTSAEMQHKHRNITKFVMIIKRKVL